MVHTLCCRFHSSAYKTSIGIDKVYYLLVVFRIFITYSTTLHHLERIQIYLYRFYSLALNRGRENKRVRFEVVFVGKYALCKPNKYVKYQKW